MPSITTWTRLEPRPRAEELTDPLAARVADPLWILARQWQLGEFQGEDAGSPANVQVTTATSKIYGWQGEDTQAQPAQLLDYGQPMESALTNEFFYEDFSIRVELGQAFEMLLRQAGQSQSVIDAFRPLYSITPPADLTDDPKTARFLNVFQKRSLDGLKIYFDLNNAGLPPAPQSVNDDFKAWVQDVFGQVQLKASGVQPGAWKPESLEYGLEVLAATPTSSPVVLAADLEGERDLGWSSFDIRSDLQPALAPPDPNRQPVVATFNIVPTHVRFRGMPNARWWDFEDARLDFGSIQVDKPELGKLIFIDFMLIHGNDWFIFPMKQETGTLSQIQTLKVCDVFGGSVEVPRADLNADPVGQRWTLFSNVAQDNTLAPYFILPAFAAILAQEGDELEEVRFFRDETADMAWAVEHLTQNGMGEPKSGQESSLQKLPTESGTTTRVPDDGRAPVKYQIESSILDTWFPLLPIQRDPAQDARLGRFALVRGSVVRDDTLPLTEPRGRILQHSGRYEIREEKVPRSGVRVFRTVYRSRWIDGSTHLWISRRKAIHPGEGSSGLRFDSALPNID